MRGAGSNAVWADAQRTEDFPYAESFVLRPKNDDSVT